VVSSLKVNSIKHHFIKARVKAAIWVFSSFGTAGSWDISLCNCVGWIGWDTANPSNNPTSLNTKTNLELFLISLLLPY
jgi:hypothetical protein